MSGKFGVFNPLGKWKKGDFPCDPTVTIILSEYFTTDEKVICLSATLATDSEIDFAVDVLQKSLESVRKQAKLVLKKQREKIKIAITDK